MDILPVTSKQLDFAERLVARLQQERNVKARHYMSAVRGCFDRRKMSTLIQEMQVILGDRTMYIARIRKETYG